MSINIARRLRWIAAAALVVMPTISSAQEQQSPARETQAGILPEPRFIARAIDFATRTMGDGSSDKNGVYAEMANMITGAGWISAGPGYRRWFAGDEIFTDMSAAFSWRSYKMARGRFEFTKLAHSRLALGSEVRWQDLTQNTYYGLGPDSREEDRSEYRLKSFDTIGYGNLHPRQWLTVGVRAGWLRSPSLLDPSGRFQRGNPGTLVVFPAEPAYQLEDQPDYVHGELSLTADTRDHRSHALRGGVYRGAWIGFSDRDSGHFSFQRFEAEGAQFVSSKDDQVTVALHGWFTASDTVDGREVPFYLLPSLGGSNTLRAFSNYRFHDRNSLLANVELRLALMPRLDLAMFMDAGNVAPRLADLNFDKRSIGVGFRLHSSRTTFARFDIAAGPEGVRITLSTNDPLHLSRLSRRTAPAPFVP